MNASDSDSLRRDIRRAFIRRILIYAGVILAIVIVFAIAFSQFKRYSNARLVLREAKNIKMGLEMVNTEYYGAGLSIYDDSADGNIRKGALEHVKKLQGEPDGAIKLFGYDTSERLITGLEYETEEYIVRYTRKGEEEKWTVSLIKKLLEY